jgi:hypothetical protein
MAFLFSHAVSSAGVDEVGPAGQQRRGQVGQVRSGAMDGDGDDVAAESFSELKSRQ